MRLGSCLAMSAALMIAALCAAQAPKPAKIRSLEDINPKDSDAAKIVAGWKTEVRALDRSYTESWNSLRRKYVKELETARKTATEADRLDDAIEIRGILEVAPTLEPAKAGEPTKTDLSTRDKEKAKPAASPDPAKAIVGNWSGRWMTSGTALSFTVDPTGLVKAPDKQAQMKIVDDRFFVIWETVHQNLELVPSGDRLIVLGYTAANDNKRLNPLKDRPDHIAVLERNK